MTSRLQPSIAKKSMAYFSRALIVACAMLMPVPAAAQEKPLEFGIVPQQAASRLAAQWGPLMAEIAKRSGVPIVFRTAANIPAFEERLSRGGLRSGLHEPLPLCGF